MRYALLALVFGLVGGVAGALALPHLLPQGEDAGEPGAEVAATDEALLARIEELEEGLRRLDGGIRLQGTGTPRAEALADDVEIPEPVLERLEARLVERLEPRMNEAIDTRIAELGAERPGSEPPRRKERPRMELRDVAGELGLSAREEDDLRRVYEEANARFLSVLAKPDGDVEQVKRDFETFQNDESARPRMMSKYVPKLVGGIGELIQIDADKRQGIEQAVGSEKAALLGDYDIVEENPYGFGGDFNVSARADMR